MTSVIRANIWQNSNGVPYGTALQVVSNTSNISSSIAAATVQTYVNLANSVTLTTRGSNSRFLIFGSQPGYCAGQSGGVSLGFRFNGTLLVGVDGTSGNSWSMHGNTVAFASAFNLNHHTFHSPSLPAGSSVTVFLCAGIWTGATAPHYFNYNNTADNAASLFAVRSSLTVMEIQA